MFAFSLLNPSLNKSYHSFSFSNLKLFLIDYWVSHVSSHKIALRQLRGRGISSFIDHIRSHYNHYITVIIIIIIFKKKELLTHYGHHSNWIEYIVKREENGHLPLSPKLFSKMLHILNYLEKCLRFETRFSKN